MTGHRDASLSAVGPLTPAAQADGHRAPDASVLLAKLRSEFPHWGIVYDPFGSRWWALRGTGITVRGATGLELGERLRTATGG